MALPLAAATTSASLHLEVVTSSRVAHLVEAVRLAEDRRVAAADEGDRVASPALVVEGSRAPSAVVGNPPLAAVAVSKRAAEASTTRARAGVDGARLPLEVVAVAPVAAAADLRLAAAAAAAAAVAAAAVPRSGASEAQHSAAVAVASSSGSSSSSKGLRSSSSSSSRAAGWIWI